jgi:hypothetical protein
LYRWANRSEIAIEDWSLGKHLEGKFLEVLAGKRLRDNSGNHIEERCRDWPDRLQVDRLQVDRLQVDRLQWKMCLPVLSLVAKLLAGKCPLAKYPVVLQRNL